MTVIPSLCNQQGKILRSTENHNQQQQETLTLTFDNIHIQLYFQIRKWIIIQRSLLKITARSGPVAA